MQYLAAEGGADKVSLFVASDTPKARSWFEDNKPLPSWTVIKSGRELQRPESGVWFGEHGSKTNKNMTQHEKDEAMAEAMADAFALGECDALFIPNYSSFNVIGVIRMRGERRKVLFMDSKTYQYHELQYPNGTDSSIIG